MSTRVVLPTGSVAPQPERAGSGDDVAMVGQAEEGRQRKLLERKEGTQPYVVRERVAGGGAIGPDEGPPPEPRREPKERATVARPASRVEFGGRTARGRREDDLRVTLRDRAGFGSSGGRGGGFRSSGGSVDLRSSISKARRTGDRGVTHVAKSLQISAARRSSAPRFGQQQRGGSSAGDGAETSRADGEWKRDLFFQLG